MKWFRSRGAKKQYLEDDNLSSEKKLPKSTTPLVVGLMVCLVGTGVFLSANALKLKKILTSTSFQESSKEINDIAAEISVKVLDEDFLGSGFIVQRQSNEYAIVTNQHVLRAGEAPFSIQTADGKIHAAEVVKDSVPSDYEYDLAVLKFTTEIDYSVAKIGSSLFLEVGEPIYAAGFPYTESEVKTAEENSNKNSITNSQTDLITGLTLKTGRIAIILNQALVEGYQIGYTNDVKKGMSGGPLLNSQGQVVGVNGKHAYPLWESPELYQDGSQPCPALEKLITRSSLAIPIEKSIKLNPQLKSLKTSSSVEVTRNSNVASEDDQLVARMQAEAQSTVQSCDQYGIDSANNSEEEFGTNEAE